MRMQGTGGKGRLVIGGMWVLLSESASMLSFCFVGNFSLNTNNIVIVHPLSTPHSTTQPTISNHQQPSATISTLQTTPYHPTRPTSNKQYSTTSSSNNNNRLQIMSSQRSLADTLCVSLLVVRHPDGRILAVKETRNRGVCWLVALLVGSSLLEVEPELKK